MEQRLSLITLVSDLAEARAFYEGLGWVTGAAPDDDVVFFQAGGIVIALWDRARLAEDSTVSDAPGWGGVTLAYNARSPAEVDDVIEQARAAGRPSAASPTRPSGAATAVSSSTLTGTRGRSHTTRTGPSGKTARS